MVINQWLPAAHAGDAVGDSARQMRRIFRRLGHQSDIYAITIDPSLVGDVRTFENAEDARGDLTIFHFAIASPMTALFASLGHGRLLQYHNITPARFFAGYDAALVKLAAEGRRELASLAGQVDLAVGDSEYNRLELASLGFARTSVLPVAVDFDRLRSATPCPTLEAMLGDDVDNVLFVGRMAPNKCIHDYIHLAARYLRDASAPARFVFAGRVDVVPRYYSALQALVSRCGLSREQIVFTGPLDNAELAACYQTADVYLSLSEHEGFCVPLLEAMSMDVPVLAYEAGAVLETMDGAGVSFAPKNLDIEAELLDVVLNDDDFRDRVIAGQRRRVADFSADAITERVAALVELATGGAVS